MSQNAIYSTAQLRQIEEAAKRRAPIPSLMQRAGYAAANIAATLCSGTAHILVFAGPGDNGGDAFEMAYVLASGLVNTRTQPQGFTVSLYYQSQECHYSVDAQASLARARASTIQFLEASQIDQALAECDLIVDGIFGIGLSRAIQGHWLDIINRINRRSGDQSRRHIPVLALDTPSGLQADTGDILQNKSLEEPPDSADSNGAYNARDYAVKASHTISFIGDKLGLHTHHGKDYAGQVSIDTLEIANTDFPTPNIFHNHIQRQLDQLRHREHASHKGSYGEVVIIGGSAGMLGAALLAGRSALMSGAGKVHLAFINGDVGVNDAARIPFAVDPLHPELMCMNANDLAEQCGVVAIGPGLGQSKTAHTQLKLRLLATEELVIDADALNLIAQDSALKTLTSERHQRHCKTILTPHPLEAARLLGISAAAVQADRLQAARRLAQAFSAVVILKGSGSLISDGVKTYVNGSGNPGLASGGTGDVLTGLCAALLAQGLDTLDAARLACYLHGAAADNLVRLGHGPVGLCASELPLAVRQQINVHSG